MNEKLNYIYIGQFYHIRNKELPYDLKIGITNNLNNRESQISNTKSPIKYMIIEAWQIPSNFNREAVEDMLEKLFDREKYPDCEWYDLKNEDEKLEFINKAESFINKMNNLVPGAEFKKVNLISNSKTNKNDINIIKEDNIRKELKNKSQLLEVIIDEIHIKESSSKKTFTKTLEYLIDNYPICQLNLENYQFIKYKSDKFSDNNAIIESYNDFYINTHSCTIVKKSQLEKIIPNFTNNFKVELETLAI